MLVVCRAMQISAGPHHRPPEIPNRSWVDFVRSFKPLAAKGTRLPFENPGTAPACLLPPTLVVP